MNTIITAATVLSMYMNLSAGTDAGYCYNADIDGGQLNTLCVYDKHDNSLSKKLQVNFLYDAAGRLVSKETLKWSCRDNAWRPAERYTYAYAADSYTVEVSRWDKMAGRYGEAGERMRYTLLMDNVVAVDTYRRNAADGTFALAGNMLVLDPWAGLLLAGAGK